MPGGRYSRQDLRKRQSRDSLRLGNMLRRVVVDVTGKLWRLLGYEGIDGEREPFENVEVFQGVGFASRPRAGKGEAIVGMVGGSSRHPVVIAGRDLEVEPDVAADETIVFNSVAKIHIKANGDIFITAQAGKKVQITDGSGAVSLALKSDVDELRTKLNTHQHDVTGITVGSQTVLLGAPPTPAIYQANPMVGTSVLEGK